MKLAAEFVVRFADLLMICPSAGSFKGAAGSFVRSQSVKDLQSRVRSMRADIDKEVLETDKGTDFDYSGSLARYFRLMAFPVLVKVNAKSMVLFLQEEDGSRGAELGRISGFDTAVFVEPILRGVLGVPVAEYEARAEVSLAADTLAARELALSEVFSLPIFAEETAETAEEAEGLPIPVATEPTGDDVWGTAEVSAEEVSAELARLEWLRKQKGLTLSPEVSGGVETRPGTDVSITDPEEVLRHWFARFVEFGRKNLHLDNYGVWLDGGVRGSFEGGTLETLTRQGFARKVCGGPSTYGHVDFYLTPEGIAHAEKIGKPNMAPIVPPEVKCPGCNRWLTPAQAEVHFPCWRLGLPTTAAEKATETAEEAGPEEEATPETSQPCLACEMKGHSAQVCPFVDKFRTEPTAWYVQRFFLFRGWEFAGTPQEFGTKEEAVSRLEDLLRVYPQIDSSNFRVFGNDGLTCAGGPANIIPDCRTREQWRRIWNRLPEEVSAEEVSPSAAEAIAEGLPVYRVRRLAATTFLSGGLEEVSGVVADLVSAGFGGRYMVEEEKGGAFSRCWYDLAEFLEVIGAERGLIALRG